MRSCNAVIPAISTKGTGSRPIPAENHLVFINGSKCLAFSGFHGLVTLLDEGLLIDNISRQTVTAPTLHPQG